MGSETSSTQSVREREIMRGCFLLLLHTCAIQGSAIEREHHAQPLSPSTCIDCAVSVPFNLTSLTGAAGIGGLPDNTDSIGDSLPASCPAFHCQRRSRKNREKMICCLLTRRFKCPNSCD